MVALVVRGGRVELGDVRMRKFQFDKKTAIFCCVRSFRVLLSHKDRISELTCRPVEGEYHCRLFNSLFSDNYLMKLEFNIPKTGAIQ